MKKSLFPVKGRFYKANLHNHTVFSDGKESPEEIKEIYRKQGYQIVAYTDHDVMISHSELTDSEFLALTGFEYEFTEVLPPEMPYSFRRTYHMLCFAPTEDTTYYPWPNPDFVWGNARKHIQPYYKGDCPHGYSVDDVNHLFEDAHAHGFLTCYCHPMWSTQHYPDYCDIKGADFVEVYNSGCYIGGWALDAGDHVYHDFLWLGSHSAPSASDDGHSRQDYCGGATYIHAEELTYEAVFNAMKNQDVYASWGPEIKDITFDPETKTLEVECTDAREIFIMSERRFAARETNKSGFPLTRASFDLTEYLRDTIAAGTEKTSFVRLLIVDGTGRKAVSRGYFAEELLKM